MENYEQLAVAFKDIYNVFTTAFAEVYKENIAESIFDQSKKSNLIVDGYAFNARNIDTIIINGCGGTGGWFIPKLAKILTDASLKGKLNDKLSIYFCDGDTVSQKNLIRQNFVARDIGKNKAEVLANRYASAIPENIKVGYVDKYIANKEIIASYDSIVASKFVDIATLPFLAISNEVNPEYSVLVFNFVDNAISRRCIHSYFYQYHRRSLVLDAGNNLYNGQVYVSSYENESFNRQLPSNYYLNNLDELKDNEFIKLENCADADLAQNNPEQMFNINDFSATVTANVANNLFADNLIYHGLTSFVVGRSVSVTTSFPYYDFTLVEHGFRSKNYSVGFYHCVSSALNWNNNNYDSFYYLLSNLHMLFDIRGYRPSRENISYTFERIGIKNHSQVITKIFDKDLVEKTSIIGRRIPDSFSFSRNYQSVLSDFSSFASENRANVEKP